MSFQQRTIFITGASRGIGKAIALQLASKGANIVIAAKSVEEDPRLGGTIYSAAEEVEAAGGKALAVQVDIREEAQIAQAVEKAVATFGGIDVLINNASAIQLTNTEQTPAKRFDLMYDINVRGTFLVTQHCIPHLKKGKQPHILTLSPPVNLDTKWLGPHVAYTISKYNMSMLAMGWAAELAPYQIASNALWPATTIATAAVKNLLGGEALINRSRTPDILADAVAYILQQPATYTGQTLIDEAVLQQAGITNFDKYAVVPGGKLQKDLFL
ncbi:NAD(P)-dependent oxidoreductase [Chitinophaga polysaccharea]|uniref:SDR family oxidoreductase n=1 Tax=Chitinophaga polysaccharea TaxID=1293035 RepID=UPI0014556223|nr:NAD(P)-dependent oxidoreductase [Chitinophaga polysaccharea]NLR62309.1 NAD(P)-dependent oxidoreductase [Chitinophaga polysaccharea]